MSESDTWMEIDNHTTISGDQGMQINYYCCKQILLAVHGEKKYVKG